MRQEKDKALGEIIATKKVYIMRYRTIKAIASDNESYIATILPITVSESQNCNHVLYIESEQNSRLEELKRYKQKHGHYNIKTNDGPLGRWTKSQYKRIQPNQLEVYQDRFEKLKSIGFHFRFSYTLDQLSILKWY